MIFFISNNFKWKPFCENITILLSLFSVSHHFWRKSTDHGQYITYFFHFKYNNETRSIISEIPLVKTAESLLKLSNGAVT